MRKIVEIIATTCILLLILVAITFTIFWGLRTNSERVIQQHLIALDQRFNSIREPSPLRVNAELFLPEQVGDFQIRDYDADNYDRIFEECRSDNNVGQTCFVGARYYKNGDSALEISVDVSEINDQDSLSSRVITECDSSGLSILRTSSQVPYMYEQNCDWSWNVINLTRIIWQNGNWLIQIEGQDYLMSQFIVAYPY